MGNLSTFATWVGIVAFFLAIPLSVAANLITPKVQRWWGSQSRGRAIKRIAILETDLARTAELSEWDYLGHTLYAGIRMASFMFGALLCGVLFGVLDHEYVLVLNGYHIDFNMSAKMILYLGTTISVVGWLSIVRSGSALSQALEAARRCSPTRRKIIQKKLEHEIEQLRKKWGIQPDAPASTPNAQFAPTEPKSSPTIQAPELSSTSLKPHADAEFKLTLIQNESEIVTSLLNDTLDTLQKCTLTLIALEEYAPDRRTFRRGQHETNIVLIPPVRIKSTDQSKARLVSTDLERKAARIEGTRISGNVGIAARIVLDKPGIWRVELLVEAHNIHRQEEHFFSWKPGDVPALTNDPRK